MLRVHQFRALNSQFVEGHTERMIHTVSVAFDVDPLEVQNFSIDELTEKYNRAIPYIDVHSRYLSTIEIGGLELSLMDFRLISLSQFINLEALINESFVGNIHKMAAHLYLWHRGGGMTELTPEDYADVNIEHRAQLIDELPINSIYGACEKYLQFRTDLFNSYDLFNDPLEGVNPEELEGEDLEEYNKELAKRSKGGNQWNDMLNVLANRDMTKFDGILNSNVYLCFNQLSWLNSNKS